MNQDGYFNHLAKTFGVKKQDREVMTEEKSPKDNLDIIEKERQLIIPKILRTEFNFLKYPFFDLSKSSKREKIEIKEHIHSSEGRAELVWKVTMNVDFGFPTAFDKKLHRAVEQILDKMPKPIQNPIKLGSLRSLCSLMKINPSGVNTNEVKNSLQRIVATTIQSKGTFYLKKSKKSINDTFHLYDRVLFSGEEFEDGRKADGVYLMLSTWYLQNINANYVVPLDWDFYQRLSGNITTRMYEFIGLSIYVALENNQNFVQSRYSKICDYFPLTRQKERWKAQKQLGPAHKELIKDKYFADVEWLDCSGKNDWLIKYYIGERAVAEWKRNKKYYRYEVKGTPEPEQLPEEDVQVQDNELTSELIKRKITKGVAEKIINKYPEERIKSWIEAFDYLKEIKSPLIGKNPAGYLRKAIEGNWSLPTNFVPKEERIKQEKKQEEARRRQEYSTKINYYKEWLQMSDKQKVKGELVLYEMRFRKRNNRMPTIDELAKEEEKLLKQLPTNEEKQIQLFGKVVFQEATPS
ncbi:MAG: hypothetical protein GF353_24685, partial [Candidatus Lokiarchaeota archaeon]|nr:hypothetical protein [Candidatus Lokiarchaeota archaeon]